MKKKTDLEHNNTYISFRFSKDLMFFNLLLVILINDDYDKTVRKVKVSLLRSISYT